MRATFDLIEDIAAELKKGFAGMTFETKTGAVCPNVWLGRIPPKRSSNTDGDPPYVLVMLVKDEDKEDKDKANIIEATVALLCCIHSKDSYEHIISGIKDVMNMADRVLLTLLDKRNWGDDRWWRDGIIERNYDMLYKAEDNSHPYYEVGITAKFKAAGIARPVIT